MHSNGAFYPGTGAPESIGIGKGKGYNVNIGWPSGGMGDAEYLAAFDRVLMPIFRMFDPELILISAGFDSALGDPLGRCRITPAGYAMMTHLLCSLGNGKVVVALEVRPSHDMSLRRRRGSLDIYIYICVTIWGTLNRNVVIGRL
jgi:histone deacetylase 6